MTEGMIFAEAGVYLLPLSIRIDAFGFVVLAVFALLALWREGGGGRRIRLALTLAAATKPFTTAS